MLSITGTTLKLHQSMMKTYFSYMIYWPIENRIIDCINKLRVALKEMKKHGNERSFHAIEEANNNAIKSLKDCLKVIAGKIDTLVNSIDSWIENVALATSLKGIGKITCLWMLVYSKNFSGEYNVRKFASLAGVAPFENSSGTSINGGFHVNSRPLKSGF